LSMVRTRAWPQTSSHSSIFAMVFASFFSLGANFWSHLREEKPETLQKFLGILYGRIESIQSAGKRF